MKKILLLFFTVLFCVNFADAQTPPFYNNNGYGGQNSFPLNTTTSNKVQWLTGPSQFASGGTGVGTQAYLGLIDTLWLKAGTTRTGLGPGPYSGLEVSFAQNQGTATSFTGTNYVTGLTSAFAPAGTYSLGPTVAGQWYPIPLTTPFLYNPALSLVIEVKQNGYSLGVTTSQTGATGWRMWGGYTATSGSTGAQMANMGFSLLSNLTCATPTAGTATFIGTDSVTLSWTENNMPAATTWEIEFGPNGFPPSGTPQITTTTNPHGIGGLTNNTSYDFHVRAYCGPGDSSYYFPILNVTTLATCPWPTNLGDSNTTATTSTIYWTDPAPTPSGNYDILLGLAGTLPDPNASATAPTIPGWTSTSFPLTNLPDNTCFDFYVRSDCGPGDSSVWTGPHTFCTLIAPLNCTSGNPSIVWSEDFINAPTGQTTLPNAAAPGWTRSGTGPFWSVDEGGTTSGSTGPVTGANTPGYIYLESSTGAGTDTAISPAIDLSGVAGAARLKFFYHMYGSSTDSLWMFVDNGTTSTLVWEIGGQQHTSSTDPYDSVVINLNSYIGQTINLRFAGRRSIGFANDMALDDFELEGCVACAAVSNINVDTASGTSATISWMDNNTPTSTRWFLEVVQSGNPPTGIPTDTSMTNPAVLTGLTPFTSYDVYVRPDCDTNGLGGWAGPVSFVACSPLAGTYTVDPGLPLGGTNFQTLNEVAVALDCGISAPVIFDMAPGASFNEQVIFDEVVGASKINTVTFNGNGDTVFFAATATADRHTIRLDGADFFNFNDVVVQATGTTFGFAMHLFNSGGDGTDCNNFKNCTFTTPTTSTSSNFAAFTASGSLTSLFTASSAGAAPDSNTVDSCTTNGGYCAFGMYGPFTAPFASGNQFTNNTMEDFAIYGTYFQYMDNTLFSKNDISRATRTSLSTFYGIFASGLGNNNLFEKNCIHDPAAANPTFSFTGYFIYMLMDAGSAANANVLQNNVVLDNQGNGTHYGMYLNNAYNLHCYHNTVVHNSTTAATGITRGIFQGGTSTLLGVQDIQNNNVVVTRNTTGASYGIYKQYATAIVDHNNVYGTTSNYNYGFNGGNQLDLAAWQASTPAVGANSVSVDPLFTITPFNGCDFTPGNAGMNDLGNTTLGITDDYFDSTRTATPDMGAFEFTVAPTDIATTNIIAPDTSLGCYTASDTITVEISNVGATTHDFTLNPTTVTVQVNGPLGPTTHTATVNTDTLPTLGTLNVVLTPTVDLTANGVYTFDAYQTTVGDPTQTNDTLATYTYNVNVVAGTLSASPDIICQSGTTDVTLVGNAGGIIQWQTSPTGMAPWTNVGAGMNPHTSATLTATTYYRALLTCNANMDSTNVDTIIVNNPMITTTMGDTVCGADTVTLGATSSSATINWYAAATGGLPLDTGSSFTTYITGTDTFYAAALDGEGKMLITEVCQFTTGGYSNPGPPYPTNLDDPIELTNIGTAPLDISGWQLQVTGGSAGIYTIPAGNIVQPGAAIVLDRGPGSPDIPGVYLNATVIISTGSSTPNGYILSDAGGVVQDVVATNSFNVVGTGSPAATAADWTGTTGPTGGTGGIRRTNVDDTNDGSDWTTTQAGTNPTNYGTINVAFTPAGCEGSRTPVVAVSTAGPMVMASASDTLVCVGDSTMLMASGAGPGGTYAWDNGGMTGVNFVPAMSPMTFTLTGTDSAGCSSVDSVVIVNADPFSGTATASPDFHCLSGSSVLDAVQGASIQWQEATSATGPWMNVGTPGTTYTTPTLTATTYYRALSTCGVNTDTSTVDTVIVSNPMILTTMGDSICGPNSATLMATSNSQTINWYDDAAGLNLLDTGSTFATPVISVTDTFYAAPLDGEGKLLITESCNFNGATGWTTPVAPVPVGVQDPIEFTNIGTSALDVSGWLVQVVGGSAGTWTFPAGAIVAPNSTVVLGRGGTPGGTFPGQYYQATTLPTSGSGTALGIILSDGNGVVQDVVAYNGYAVVGQGTPAATAADWSGNVPSGSGTSGIRRVVADDNNDASDWSVASGTNLTNYGAVNLAFTPAGCKGALVPVIAVVTPGAGNLALATTSNVSSNTGIDSNNYMQADGQLLSYYNPTCELIATIDDAPGGNALGMVTSEVTVEPAVTVWNTQPYTRRWFDITPTSNGPADVTIYQTQDDFDDFNAYSTVVSGVWDSLPTSPTDAAGIANLRVTHVTGGTLGVGTAALIVPVSVIWNATAAHWEITFPVTSFSEFYVHTNNNYNAPLPVTLTKFGVTKEGSVSLAAWITESERNNSHFNLQRSLDGNSFTTLGQVSTKAVNGNSDVALNYDFTDESPEIGHNYYRLEQVDQDGNLSYSKIVDVVWGADGSIVSIYPNPATDKLNVDVSISKVAQLEVRLLDMSGRVIKSTLQQTVKGMNNVTLDLSDIATGVYGVQIYQNNNLIHTSKVNKQSK
jgi:hypothetical protein